MSLSIFTEDTEAAWRDQQEPQPAAGGQEWRIFGPPGTGKTYFTSRQIANAARTRGSESILVASFTRTAASEIAGRNLPLPKGQIGTLHALCYRMLGRPVIAETRLDDWNEQHPSMAISGGGQTSIDPDEPAWDEGGGAKHGDKMMQAYERLRAQRVDEAMWPTSVRAFSAKWEEWKQANDLLDFTDLIETVYEQGMGPPGQASVGFFDEAQDFTPLELSLARLWGSRMEMFLMAGDDDQVLYSFKGATPDAFLDPPLPDSQVRVLGQSYRVPRAVHEIAQGWITQVSHRQPKEYAPRDADGDAWRLTSATWRSPERVVELAIKRMLDDRTVMILGACSYMLDPVRKLLRAEGVPFANRFRVRRGDWNPLASRRGSVNAAERVLAFLRPDVSVWGAHSRVWNAQDLSKWMSVVKAKGVFAHGAKARVSEWAEAGGVTPLEYDEAASLFADWDQFAAALDSDLEWLRSVLLPRSAKPMGYAIDVAKAFGAAALLSEPPVTLGTVHSVKGGECSPPDEPVLTTNRGYVPIGELNPDTDMLVSFDSDHHKIYRGGPRRPDGYGFTKSSRPYSGRLLTIRTESSKTRVTPNHWLTVRWTQRAMDATAVYLMRRGDWWRIGMVAMQGASRGASGIVSRMNHQCADGLWILGLFDNRRDAVYHEQLLSHWYGVPDLLYEDSKTNGRVVLTANELHSIWNQIDSSTPAKALLDDYGLNPDWPMYGARPEQGIRRRQVGLRNRWLCRAVNLVPGGFMELPTDPGSGQEPHWKEFTIDEEHYEGPVYFLEVDKWSHYISGGAVVHNSDTVILFPDVSRAGMSEWLRGGASSDSVVRQFYVGMTRASEELVVPHPASKLNVDIGRAM